MYSIFRRCFLSAFQYGPRSYSQRGLSDYYQTLQVPPTASPDEIRQAYRRLAMKWHPDKNPQNQAEATTKFKELSNAYEILRDPVKRDEYNAARWTTSESSSRPPVRPRRRRRDSGFDWDEMQPPYGSSGSNPQQVIRKSGERGWLSYLFSSYDFTTVIHKEDGRKVITRRVLKNGVEIVDVFVNGRHVSSTRQT